MNRTGHENVTFFIGPEVEHTPAYSKKTLFVVGKQPLDQIERIARENKTPHIFMGANHSFNVESEDPYWDQVITALLDKGFWVTLDYQAHEHKKVLRILNPGVWQSRLFVPLLSVRIPKVQTSSPNLTIKIDDVDFNATNPGVWCLHHHEITDSNRFTDWSEYSSDAIIEKLDDKATPMPPYTPEPKKVKAIDITKLQPVEIKALEDPDVREGFNMRAEAVSNPHELGLDTVPVQVNTEIPQIISASLTTETDVVDAYTDGVKADPLGKKGGKKK